VSPPDGPRRDKDNRAGAKPFKKDYRKRRPGTREVERKKPAVHGRREEPTAEAARSSVHSSGLPILVVSFTDTRTKRLRHGWIYDNMVVAEPEQGAELNGSAVAVMDQAGKFLGSAIYNTHSKIRGRIFSLNARQFDERWVREAIDAVLNRRAALFSPEDSYRLIFADSDALPGVVADKIGDVVVVQLLTLAADRQSDVIVTALQERVRPAGILLRRDIAVRQKEGLAVTEPQIIGTVPPTVSVQQDGFTVFADLLTGQKTGLFLDQRFNRRLIKPWCKDARVLDLYCYVGAWSFTAALAGAREIIGVDSSAAACELARRGAAENGMQQVSFVTSEVFDYFDKSANEPFDLIVCDPPAFAKTRAHVPDALKAYLSLNYRCMKNLKPGGILVSCSCSQHVGGDEFETMLTTAARNARMQFQVVMRSSQPPDHPVLIGFPESEYLKCAILQRTE
jgi:23S rRNA (cytosine1962-C5)-methyltransferase